LKLTRRNTTVLGPVLNRVLSPAVMKQLRERVTAAAEKKADELTTVGRSTLFRPC
jgi:hypothetical protein